MGSPLQPEAVSSAALAGPAAVQGHIPLCLVQHDDRTDKEISPSLVSLLDLNRAVCESHPGCRLLLTRTSLDKEVEPHWQKLYAVQAALQEGCQHAVWLDTDAIVHTSDPMRLLGAFPRGTSFFSNADPPAIYTMRFFRNMPASWDPMKQPVQPFNAGVWGVRNTHKGRALMERWTSLYPAHLWSVERSSSSSKGGGTKLSKLCIRVRPGGPAITRLSQRQQNVYRGSMSFLSAEGAAAEPPPSASHAALESTEQALGTVKSMEAAKHKVVTSCDAGVVDYAFHEKWRCVGSSACNTWANSDAFEQGAFAAHILSSPEWRPHINVADAGLYNSPCESYGDAEKRDALSCHFLAEYKDAITNYLSTRRRAAVSHEEEVAAGNPGALKESPITLPDPPLTRMADEDAYEAVHPMVRVLLERVDPYLVMRTNATSAVCHIGADDHGKLAARLAAHLRMPNTIAHKATTRDDAEADSVAMLGAPPHVQLMTFKGARVSQPAHSCDVVVIANMLHHAAHAHKTARLLKEAARISRGFVLFADHRAGRTLDEIHALTAHDPHGVYRTMSEWEGLLHGSGLQVLASGPMAHTKHKSEPSISPEESTRIFYIARPTHGHAIHMVAHGFQLSEVPSEVGQPL